MLRYIYEPPSPHHPFLRSFWRWLFHRVAHAGKLVPRRRGALFYSRALPSGILPRMKARTVKILFTVESIWAFGSGLFLPIFAIFSTQIGGDITDAGIAAGIFLIVTSSLQWLIGEWIDRLQEKWFIVADYLLEAFVFFGYIFVQNIWQLFVLQVVLGIANAIGDPAWESLFGKSIPKASSGKLWSRSHLWIGYASGFGIILGGYLAHHWGFRSIFFVGGVLSLVAAIMSMYLLKNTPGKKNPSNISSQ